MNSMLEPEGRRKAFFLFVFVPKPPTDSGTLANVAFLYKIGFTSEDIGQFN